jgi:cytochrome bd ubiquinol oxidase subunit I
MEFGIVELSRLQFAMTAMYHFLFVPLTLGLSILVAIMETVYVMTNRPIWRQMTKFWGTLFGINFVLGVATGITMEFQFGMNWSYYSHYVGDIFGAPWRSRADGLLPGGHVRRAVLLRLGQAVEGRAPDSDLAGGHRVQLFGPVDPDRQRLDAEPGGGRVQSANHADGDDRFLRCPIQRGRAGEVRAHVSAGYVTAAVFVIGVSAWYLLKGRHIELARRSITVAAAFGLASAFSVVLLGDESGYSATHSQKMKLAAIEAMWETHEAPAPFNLIGFPRPGSARDALRHRDSLGDGPDRHPVADHRDPRASTIWSRRPKTASGRASSPMTR